MGLNDNQIYLDNASTRRPHKAVVQAYAETSLNVWSNPANTYALSDMAKCLLDNAKLKIANTIGCLPEEIFFTSGASEGNNWASIQREQLWISAYEHHNYSNNLRAKVVSEEFLENIYESKPDLSKVVFSHQLVNNEVGMVFNVAPMFKKMKELGAFTACDATQAIYNMPINVYDLECDMMIVSGHKFGGLKGSGWVFIKKDAQENIKPLIIGTQQKGLRGGTEDIAKSYAVAVASDMAFKNMSKKILHCGVLRSLVKERLKESGIDYRINEGEYNITSTINFSLADIESEILQAILSDERIFIGTQSACADGSMSVSPVLEAMGVEEKYLHGPIRLSFSEETQMCDVEYAMDKIIEKYKELVNG